MLRIERHFQLRPFNTLAIAATAREIAFLEHEAQLPEVYRWLEARSPRILGGGSNLVLSANIETPVLKMQTSTPVRYTALDDDRVKVSAPAGMSWHALVLETLQHDLAGLENLSLIPGTVGASPIQNIGAYGVEIKDCFASLRAWNWRSNEYREFDAQDMAFGYRDSFFKQSAEADWVVLEVSFFLRDTHRSSQAKRSGMLQLDYGEIRAELSSRGVLQPTAKDVSHAVIAIRSRKLPNPDLLPNAGSFFKNPIVREAKALALKERFPAMPQYPAAVGETKLSAAWMIDQCDWKGKSSGDAAVHEAHALVLVNRGNATGEQILHLSSVIQASVCEKFGVELEREPVRW